MLFNCNASETVTSINKKLFGLYDYYEMCTFSIQSGILLKQLQASNKKLLGLYDYYEMCTFSIQSGREHNTISIERKSKIQVKEHDAIVVS